MHSGPRAEVDEQRQHVGMGTGAAARLGEDVKDRQDAAWRDRVADPAEQVRGIVRHQVVDEVEAEYRVVAGAEVRRGGVAVAEQDPVRQAGGGDQLAADRGAAGQVEDGRSQRRMALTQRRGVSAMAAADVKQRAGAGWQRELLRDLGRRQPGQFRLAGHVAPPVGVAGLRLVRAACLAGADGLVQAAPPGPVVGGPRHVGGDRQRRGGIEPAPGAPAQPVLAGPLGDVPRRPQAVEQEPGG